MANGADLVALINQVYGPNDPVGNQVKEALGDSLVVPEATMGLIARSGPTGTPGPSSEAELMKLLPMLGGLGGLQPNAPYNPGPGPGTGGGTPNTPAPPAGANPFAAVWDSMKPQPHATNFGMLTTGIPMRGNGAPNSRKVWSDDEVRALG